MTRDADVLVVGAGPTGLALALYAHDHGARVRVVERRPQAFRPSRALIAHPRTLEVLRPLGVTDDLLARGDMAPSAALHAGPRTVQARLAGLDLPDTAFPHLTLVRQMDVEEVLAAALEQRGVTVERGTELLAADGSGESATAVLRSPHGIRHLGFGFIAGCDGPASTVRSVAGIGWRGGPYAEEAVLADLEFTDDPAAGGLQVVVGRAGLVFLFPLGELAPWRLLATRRAPAGERPAFGQPGPALRTEELEEILRDAGVEAAVGAVPWSARVPLQHRLAPTFRRGRLFLAGDAAHAYSPATGQGMNAGIQDAANLGWKLAFAAAQNRTAVLGALLDSYTRERRPAALRRLLLTHAAFWGEASTDPLASLLRGRVLPLATPAVPLVLRRRRLVASGVRTLSQLRTNYRTSALSTEAVPRLPGRVRAGDRLPDAVVTCEGRRRRLHALLAAPGIHLLLYRDADRRELPTLGPQIHVHELDDVPGRGVVIVRPDGHIGFRCAAVATAQISAWLRRVGAVPG